jgi:chromosome segregation ATPase
MIAWMRQEVEAAQEPFGTMPKYNQYHVKPLMQNQRSSAPQQQHEPKKQVPEKKAESVTSLQEEMEKMKISRDLQYVTEQHQKVSAELQYHQKRVRARDDRVKQLEQELISIRKQEKRLEEQLSEERTWKKTAVTSMETLKLELKSLEDQKRGLGIPSQGKAK